MNLPTSVNPYAISEDEKLQWMIQVGRLVMNFGAVEYISYNWIRRLCKDDAVRDASVYLDFSDRVRLIKKLMKRIRPESEEIQKLKEEADKLWNEARKLSETRNLVAHNPIIFSWDGVNPVKVGIVNTKKVGNGDKFETSHLLFQEVKNAASELDLLSTNLDALISSFDKHRFVII